MLPEVLPTMQDMESIADETRENIGYQLPTAIVVPERDSETSDTWLLALARTERLNDVEGRRKSNETPYNPENRKWFVARSEHEREGLEFYPSSRDIRVVDIS